MDTATHKRIVIAGGGTGGHIFPAVAVANALRLQSPDVEILFIGARGKMEMEKVPKAGYTIEGLDITGFDRGNLIKNITLPFKLMKSFWQVRSIFKRFKPDAAFGVGGYSSYPVLRYAQMNDIKTFLHEANAFGGRSNQMLAKKARRVFVGTKGMERFFPSGKILFTGNPVRKEILQPVCTRDEALAYFGLDGTATTMLVVGGSLGARSINLAVQQGIQRWVNAGHNLIWQTGKLFIDEARTATINMKNVYVSDFITDMSKAYLAADMVISRAGAMSVTELCLTAKPAIFVPFPFAAEDHQTANAMALVRSDAALLVKDNQTAASLMDTALELAGNKGKREKFINNIRSLATDNADTVIAAEILKDINA